MNWFDATGIANLAKTALKEAQKQIDKALDIKDDDQAIGIEENHVASDDDSKAFTNNPKQDPAESDNSGRIPRSASLPVDSERLTDTRINENVTLGKYSTQPQQAANLWGSFTGSFFEQPTGNVGNVTVTKAPVCDASSIASPIVSPQIDKDSSESIEVLSSVISSTSTITSPSQLPSIGITSYHGNSESDEVLDTFGTPLTVSPPDCLSSADHGTGSQEETCNENDHILQSRFQLHRRTSGDHDESISVEDDTLSNKQITSLETNSSMSPITVAPMRNCLHLNLSHVIPANEIQEADRAIPSVETNTNNTPSPIVVRQAFLDPQESVDSEGAAECNHNRRTQHQAQYDEQELDRSYENVEIQTQTSDSTQSFEEITRSGIALDVKKIDEMHRGHEQMQCSEQLATVEYSLFAKEAIGGQEELGGVHTSCPNSGDDDIETTTSSDIEIISSPNGGDSSSTHSNGAYRTSPLKNRGGKGDEMDILFVKKHHGHVREPSEVSIHSGNSDESCQQPESEQLMRRLVEVSETLEQREYRLVELGRQNAELQEQNAALQSQLDSKTKRAKEGCTDSEGYTLRLSALERKFQQAIRDKEGLKQQLNALRAEEQQKVTRGEVDKALAERDFMIGELQKEGESLSKQVLHHSNIIKKLRVKEKESDSLIRKQRCEIGELVEEAERLKRSLSAKEEVERSQIDAVHKLSSEKQKLELDCVQLKSNLEDQAQRLETLRKSFDFARKELSDQAESYRELKERSTKLQVIESEHGRVQRASEQLSMQLEELREQLRRTEHDYGQRLLRMKKEHSELLSRLEATEMRAEEEKNAAASLTIPLMKQLESLQNTLRHKEHVWEQREAAITQQLTDALQHSTSTDERERTQSDQIISMQSRISNLEDRLTVALFKLEETTNELQQKQLDVDLLERDLRKERAAKDEERLVLSERLIEKERLVSKLEQRLQQDTVGSNDTALALPSRSSERIAATSLTNQHNSHQSAMPNQANPMAPDTLNEIATGLYTSKTGAFESSPTPSIGNLSLSESLVSIPWNQNEDEMGSLEVSSGFPEGVSGVGLASVNLLNNTSLLETLQATLKQRDGEVQQLQWELDRFKQERHILNTEISNLTIELDNIREKSEQRNGLEEEHMEQQKRYDALLQMYGESVEKTEELRLDLVDVKEMYKLQIDDLLRQQRELLAPNNSSQHPPVSSKVTGKPE